ncbi:isoprenylcysteine carboxylmethyltransferase family protein [Candidatus Thorarchaeota archaeon]|nr:MAG: isoprenylcysteine carboxylmethyltransferase family protein [Candidatus Thorarchaeota archaeon]
MKFLRYRYQFLIWRGLLVSEIEVTENNFLPMILAVLNFSVLLLLTMQYMAASVELWDFIFVGGGVYFSMKFIRLVRGAHEYPETRESAQTRSSFPTKGIYAVIRHPIGAACIYMNIAYVCFTRSFALIPVVPIFIALWYIYAAYEEKILIERFGDDYREYMQSTSMFRGSGFDQQRLASSGYDMY